MPVFLFVDNITTSRTLSIEGVKVVYLQICDLHGAKGIDLVAYLSCISEEDNDPLCAISAEAPSTRSSAAMTCLHLYDRCLPLGVHSDMDTIIGFMVHTLALGWMLAPDIINQDEAPMRYQHPVLYAHRDRRALYQSICNAYALMDGKQYSGIIERETLSERIFVPYWGRIFATLCEYWHFNREPQDLDDAVHRIIDEHL